MAITRLTDFITVATSKWTYGDSAFKYEGEVNQDHDTIYPLMVMTPPSSRMPDIYEGWEHYNVEMEFYNTYQTSAQNAVTLQQRWDNLEDLALEWLDNVLINYSGGVIQNVSTSSPTPTQVYIDKESLRIERIKNDKNDKLCRITMSFDMRMFTRCFTPKSVYPNTISELKLWLKADSGVTFNIPTKKISAWADQSDASSDVSQNNNPKFQPLRYGYDGPLDKAQIVFDGADDMMDSDANAPFESGEMSFFFVSRTRAAAAVTQVMFSMNRNDISIFTAAYKLGDILVSAHGSGNLAQNTITVPDGVTEWNICYCQLRANTPTNYSVIISINGGAESGASNIFQPTDYSTAIFQIGCTHLGGVNGQNLDGSLAEIIGYDKAIKADEKSQVLNYLNNKYKIY
tara:strand:+ start:607 stop:1809 length:1203 start_codon:yes stop_codon:yes gene_type:complete